MGIHRGLFRRMRTTRTRFSVMTLVLVTLAFGGPALGQGESEPCGMPPGISSDSHVPCVWSRDPAIAIALDRATFGTEVEAFSYVFDGLPGTAPDRVDDAVHPHDRITADLAQGDRYFHVRARQGATWGEPRHAGPFRIDTTGPSRPIVKGPTLTRRFQPVLELQMQWTSTDPLSGVTSYVLSMRRSRTRDVAKQPMKVWRTIDASGVVPLHPGYHYLFTVQARDRVGNRGPVATMATSTPFDQADRKHGAGWRRVREPDAYGGTYSYTRRDKAEMWSSVEGRTLAALVTRCPGCGSFDAYLGDRYLGRVDLQAPRVERSRVVELLRAPKVVRGRLRLVSRTSNKPVIIEGFGASLRQAAKNDPALHARRVAYPGSFMQGPSTRKMVALTFDDAGNTRQVRAILAALKKGRARGTFFILGDWVQRAPELARSIEADGHQIANHSFDHTNFLQRPGALDRQLRRTEAAFERAGLTGTAVFRFPYGATNAALTRKANAAGFGVAGWDIDTRGYTKRPAGAISSSVLREARNGSVVLMHLHARTDIQALPAVIRGLQRKGFALVTLEEMFSRGA